LPAAILGSRSDTAQAISGSNVSGFLDT